MLAESKAELPALRRRKTERHLAHRTGQRERLKDAYDRYFEVIAADSHELREISFRLRYEVYCEENAFLDPLDNPGRRETDDFEEQSSHALLIYRKKKQAAGTVRLILPGEGDHCFPLHSVCDHELLHTNNQILPRLRTGEISRFAVSKAFRQRVDDKSIAGGINSSGDDPRRTIVSISLGLMRAVVSMARDADVTHVCAIMDPVLLRMLRRLGIYFESLGPLVDYHGLRQPCYAELDALLNRVWYEREDVWEVLTNDGILWPLNVKHA